jgi:hypothetical protein
VPGKAENGRRPPRIQKSQQLRFIQLSLRQAKPSQAKPSQAKPSQALPSSPAAA